MTSISFLRRLMAIARSSSEDQERILRSSLISREHKKAGDRAANLTRQLLAFPRKQTHQVRWQRCWRIRAETNAGARLLEVDRKTLARDQAAPHFTRPASKFARGVNCQVGRESLIEAEEGWRRQQRLTRRRAAFSKCAGSFPSQYLRLTTGETFARSR